MPASLTDVDASTTNGSVHIDGLGGYETASQSSAEVTVGSGSRQTARRLTGTQVKQTV